ncbi:hypothetical protein [Demequina sp.]|uniref:hypothetical protein n=1 Tax=Demequina sp. TaxID=2050685 RepID=UPI003D0E16BA
MSDLRRNLDEWALGHGDHVAAAVASHERATRRAIHVKRRNRILATGATAAAAVVGIVAIASALPGPAGTTPAANDYVTADQLTCGQPWDLEQGTTEFMEGAPAFYGGVDGDWVATADSGDETVRPGEILAGHTALSWRGTAALAGNTVARATVVAVKDGVIVGAASEPGASVFDGTTLTAFGTLPGTCGDTTTPMDSGEYTYHVVVGIEQVQNQERPVVMFVDPGGPLVVEVNGLTESSAPQTQPPSGLIEPQGDVYQAFVVPRPTPTSCTPYQDMIDAGQPLVPSHMQYQVTIPGVQPVTADSWMSGPVAIIDDPDYRAWYTDLPTAIVATNFGGGNPLGSLAWTAGPSVSGEVHPDQLRLVNTDDALLMQPQIGNCVFTLPGPTVSGAVYLIIDGIDLDGVNEANPGVDFDVEAMQTWVYLGQAE